MALAPEKEVQAYIQGLIQVVAKVKEADSLAQDLKAKFITKNPDLTNANISAGQITAVDTFIGSLNALANDVVVSTVESKDHPSHGTSALG